jgi:glycosyltransferase involved in cell wall biosynthesis
MKMKKRILMCNESSLLSTGYSTYGYEVLTRLYNTGKYELAELAAYGKPDDPASNNIPWKYFPVLPRENDERGKAIYNSKPSNQFGEFIFDNVCASFKPDIVFDIRDTWMLEFEERSPARQYYHWAIMPTVDSAPQNDDWIPTYTNADAVFTYSDWGLDVLNQQGRGRIKTISSAPPGANLKDYKCLDKIKVRKQIGLPEDALIIGTVMRNQVRKLYPDLMEAFAKFLNVAPPEIAKRSYLYIHTAYPDVGWDIPRLLKEYGVGHRTYFTYQCLSCKEIYPSHFQDGRASCRFCGKADVYTPNIRNGVPPSILNEIMALFDIYVQYATCEGFGMPQIEAASSGTPIMSVDYSAMSDIVKKLSGYPIRIHRMFRDSGTESYRALPDNDDLIDKLIKFFHKPKEERIREGVEARKAVELYYTWEKTAAIWEKHFDSVVPLDKWKEPAKLGSSDLRVPSSEMSNTEFVNWAFDKIANRPDLVNSYLAIRLARDLGLGMCIDGLPNLLVDPDHSSQAYTKFGEFTREKLARHLMNLCEMKNNFEKRRTL